MDLDDRLKSVLVGTGRAVLVPLVTTVAFLVGLTAWGRRAHDPAVMVAPDADPETMEALEQETSTLDLFVGATSHVTGESAWSMVLSALPETILLVFLSTVPIAVVALPIIAAGLVDERIPRGLGLPGGWLLAGIPAFVLATIALFLGVRFGPIQTTSPEGLSRIVPALVVAIVVLGIGLRTVARHPDPRSLFWDPRPLVQDGWMAGVWFVGAIVVVETLFLIDGVGRLWIDAIVQRDVAVVVPATLVLCLPLLWLGGVRELAWGWGAANDHRGGIESTRSSSYGDVTQRPVSTTLADESGVTSRSIEPPTGVASTDPEDRSSDGTPEIPPGPTERSQDQTGTDRDVAGDPSIDGSTGSRTDSPGDRSPVATGLRYGRLVAGLLGIGGLALFGLVGIALFEPNLLEDRLPYLTPLNVLGVAGVLLYAAVLAVVVGSTMGAVLGIVAARLPGVGTLTRLLVDPLGNLPLLVVVVLGIVGTGMLSLDSRGRFVLLGGLFAGAMIVPLVLRDVERAASSPDPASWPRVGTAALGTAFTASAVFTFVLGQVALLGFATAEVGNTLHVLEHLRTLGVRHLIGVIFAASAPALVLGLLGENLRDLAGA